MTQSESDKSSLTLLNSPRTDGTSRGSMGLRPGLLVSWKHKMNLHYILCLRLHLAIEIILTFSAVSFDDGVMKTELQPVFLGSNFDANTLKSNT